MPKDKDYAKYSDLIKISKEYREKKAKSKQWETYIKYYKGEFHDDYSTQDRITVNMVHPNVKVLQAALSARHPEIIANARREEFEGRAPLVANQLNYTIKDIGYKYTLRKVIRDTHLMGTGVLKVGYDFETTEGAETPVHNLYVKKNQVYAIRVSPTRFFIDPDANENLDDSKFVIETIVKPKKEIEDKYKIDLSTTASFIPDFIMSGLKDLGLINQQTIEKSTIYEIWDIVKHKRIVVIEGYKDKIFEYDWVKGLEDFPYELLMFADIPDEAYGIPEVKLYESQQKEKNSIRSIMANHVKRNNPRYSMLTGGVDPKEIEKFEKNVDNSLIQFKVAGAIMPIPVTQTGNDLYQYEPRIDADVDSIMGISEIMKGSEGNIRKSATEASSSDFYSRLRIGERQDDVDIFTLKTMKKILNIQQEEYDSSRYIKMLGEDGKYMWKEYNKKNIAGEFDLETKTTTATSNRSMMVQQVSDGYKMLNGNPYISQKELTQVYVDTVFEDFDTTKIMIPDADEISKDPIKKHVYDIMMKQTAQGGAGLAQPGPGGQPGQPGPGGAGGIPPPPQKITKEQVLQAMMSAKGQSETGQNSGELGGMGGAL